ncbi:MAG: hypothetical protein ACYC99_07835 [Candidatus Geothermincolia bacterium]
MDELQQSAIAYLQANPLIAGAVGVVLLYLLVRKTKLFLFLILLGAILGAVFYLIGDLAGKGRASKTKMIYQTETQDVK